MLEFAAVYVLQAKNGQIAESKGLSPTRYRVGTAGLFLGGELLGAIVGALMLGRAADALSLYASAVLGAAAGALAAYYWVSQAPADPQGMLEASLGDWRPTHVAPPAGMPGWATPDGSQTSVVTIPPGAELALMERQADWARVRGFNGWTGWVDGRELQPTYGRSPARPSPEK